MDSRKESGMAVPMVGQLGGFHAKFEKMAEKLGIETYLRLTGCQIQI